MLLLRRRSSGDVHWSKDYIEHLRAVHFVLVVVAVTCIAFSTAPTFKQMHNAQHQLRTIRNFIEMELKLQDQVLADSKAPENPTKNWLVFTYEGTKYFAAEPGAYLVVSVCDLATIYSGIDRYSDGEWQGRFSKAENLDAFRNQWDQYNCGKASLIVVENFSTTLASGSPTTLQHVQATKGELMAEGRMYARFEISDRDPVRWNHYLWLEGKQLTRSHTSLARSEPFDPQLLEMRVAQGRLDSGHSAYLPVRAQQIANFQGERLGDALFENGGKPCRKEFSQCFYDLSRLTEGLGEYPLQELADLLDNEIKRQALEFEAFGIKFPNEDLSRWGIVLTLAILAYFCLHLRELSPQVLSTDTGLEVAWLGLYSSWYSFALFWFSVLAVPLVAVILLGMSGAKYRGPFRETLRSNWGQLAVWIVFPSLICCALAVSSCLAARKLASLAATARRNDVPNDPPC